MIRSVQSSLASRLGSNAVDERRVAVHPVDALDARRHLFAALEQLFDVTFVEATEALPEDVARLTFESSTERSQPLSPAIRAMVFESQPEAGAARGGDLQFSAHPAVDRRLRNRMLREDICVLRPCSVADGDAVLATSDTMPVWVRSTTGRGSVDRISLVPVEIVDGESLRDHLAPGRCAALLPLFSFLRELNRDRAWTPPPLRAAVILDDPNLHWSSYGYVHYPELARNAERHGYHAVMATVPLDGWYAHQRAAKHFRGAEGRLSLTVHGNAHRKRELETVRTFEDAIRLAAQALRRTASFERRTGLDVDRVMVPPHGACSPAALQALTATGFEAACVNRPYPWVARLGDSPFKHPAPWRPLTGMASTEIVGGCPMLMRQTFGAGDDDVLLRAYLDQPLLIYGHHDDLAAGLDVLEEAAGRINGLGTVEWCRLRDISRSSFEQRHTGERLSVRPIARRLTIQVPDEVRHLEFVLPWAQESGTSLRARAVGADGPSALASVHDQRAAFEIGPDQGPLLLDVNVEDTNNMDIRALPAPRPNPWLLMRRVAAEARDRARPALSRRWPPC